MYQKLHSFDIYAKPITLTFNNKPSFATAPGGLCSCLTIILFLIFAFFQIWELFGNRGGTDDIKTEDFHFTDSY
jgi:hypothetical protein